MPHIKVRLERCHELVGKTNLCVRCKERQTFIGPCVSVGSPLPLLFYLNGTRLVARRRHSGGNVPQQQEDVTLDAVGVEGCLAAEQIHNVRRAH